MEGFVLLAAAVMISSQAGVSLSIRAQLSAYSVVWRLLHYVLYLLDLDFFRSLAWFNTTLPCLLLLASAAIPGFTKEYLSTGF
jgi:uncharacterized MAPEG superfamily protein